HRRGSGSADCVPGGSGSLHSDRERHVGGEPAGGGVLPARRSRHCVERAVRRDGGGGGGGGGGVGGGGGGFAACGGFFGGFTRAGQHAADCFGVAVQSVDALGEFWRVVRVFPWRAAFGGFGWDAGNPVGAERVGSWI